MFRRIWQILWNGILRIWRRYGIGSCTVVAVFYKCINTKVSSFKTEIQISNYDLRLRIFNKTTFATKPFLQYLGLYCILGAYCKKALFRPNLTSKFLLKNRFHSGVIVRQIFPLHFFIYWCSIYFTPFIPKSPSGSEWRKMHFYL